MEGPVPRGRRAVRPDSGAITPGGGPIASPLGLEGAAPEGRGAGTVFSLRGGMGGLLLRRLGVSPFTVGRSPSAWCKGGSRAERDRSEAETLAPGATVSGR